MDANDDLTDEHSTPKTRKVPRKYIRKTKTNNESSTLETRSQKATKGISTSKTRRMDTTDEDYCTPRFDAHEVALAFLNPKIRKLSKTVTFARPDVSGDSIPRTKKSFLESFHEMQSTDKGFSPKHYKHVPGSKKNALKQLDLSPQSKRGSMGEYSAEKDARDDEPGPSTSTRTKTGHISKKLKLFEENNSSKRIHSPEKGSTDPDSCPTTGKKSKPDFNSQKLAFELNWKKKIISTTLSDNAGARNQNNNTGDHNETAAITELALYVRPGNKNTASAREVPPVPHRLLTTVTAAQNVDAKLQMIPGRPGRPVQLFLYCFMNHEFFVLDLKNGQNIICITGENGTGKSAISIAVSFVLGCNANQLGRTSKMEELIKEGRDFAQVDIVLTNSDDCLNENQYGSYIGIRRIIDRNNCSRFKICKADITKEPKTWKFRDLCKKELMYIKGMLGIMPENPLQILQQVEVSNFQKFSDRDKYSLFYEGIRITPCENILETAREDIKLAQGKPDLKFQMQCNNRRILKIESDLKIMEEIDNLEKELKWALATEAEEKKKTAETNLVQWKELNKECENQWKETNELLKACKRNFKLEEAKLNQMTDERQRKDQVYDKKKQELKSADFEIKKVSNIIKNRENDIGALKKEIQDLQPISREQLDRNELRQKIENDILPKINLVSHEIKNLEESEHDRNGYINRCERTERNLKARQNELKDDIAEKQREIDNAKNTKGKLQNNWPPLIKKFTEIVNSTTFRKKPRGPMCIYLTVKEEKWRSVIECALRSKLFHFTVDNWEDETLMKAIFVQVFGKRDKVTSGVHITPSIFCSKFLDKKSCKISQEHVMQKYLKLSLKLPIMQNNDHQYCKHDVSKWKSTGTKYPTIFDMIDINDDPVVYNWILDTTNIESTLLIEDAKVAHRLMSVSRPEIKNCVGAYTSDFYFITPQPTYACWANSICTSIYLQLSSADMPESQISQLENQKHLLETEFAEVIKNLEVNFENLNQERKTHDTNHQKIIDKMKQLDQLIYEQTQLSDKLENLQPDAATQNDEIQNHLRELKNMEAENDKCALQIEMRKEQVQNLKKEMRSLELEKPVLNQKIVTVEEAKKSFAQDETVYKQKLEDYNNTRQNEKKNIKKLEAEIKAVSLSVTLKVNEAEQLCQRIIAPRASSSVKFDLDSRRPPQKIYTEEEKKKLKQEMDTIKSQIREDKIKLIALHHMTDAVKSMIYGAEKYLQRTKGIYTNRLFGIFQNYMTEFRAVGKIIVSDTDKTLSLSVEIDRAWEDSKGDPSATLKDNSALARQCRNNMNNLSGGERTFSTFLFILSTWYAMECGFFIVDEIDLFLDAVNQQKCQEFLFEYMRKTPEAMFFHISPNPIHSTIRLPPARILSIELKKRESDGESGAN